jgi:hypothetical protein
MPARRGRRAGTRAKGRGRSNWSGSTPPIAAKPHLLRRRRGSWCGSGRPVVFNQRRRPRIRRKRFELLWRRMPLSHSPWWSPRFCDSTTAIATASKAGGTVSLRCRRPRSRPATAQCRNMRMTRGRNRKPKRRPPGRIRSCIRSGSRIVSESAETARQYGDVDPELDEIDAAPRTEQGCGLHDHEHHRLD